MARRVWLSPVHEAALSILRDAHDRGEGGADPVNPDTHIDGRTVRALLNRGWASRGMNGLIDITEKGREALNRNAAGQSIEDLLSSP